VLDRPEIPLHTNGSETHPAARSSGADQRRNSTDAAATPGRLPRLPRPAQSSDPPLDYLAHGSSFPGSVTIPSLPKSSASAP